MINSFMTFTLRKVVGVTVNVEGQWSDFVPISLYQKV